MGQLANNRPMTNRPDVSRRQAGFVSIEGAVLGTTLVIVAFAIALGAGATTFLAYFGLPFSG